MKKVFYILFAAAIACLVSCSKEVSKDNELPVNPIEKTGRTITFTASIDLQPETKAALDGLNIQWQDGDYIGIATDNNATIVAYAVTVDALDATKCSITVDEVAGATAYYAIFKGSLGDNPSADPSHARAANDFSDISFDTVTKTFSGLTVGNQQVAVGSLESYLWYSNGYPLAMAGKTSGSSLVMRPCLAMAKLQINSESVPAEYFYKTITYKSTYDINHNYDYSAVRGFNFYQKGGSTIYSSGDYTVQVAADGSLTTAVVDNANKKEYRQMTQSAKLTANTDYIMCIIPGGDITSFKIDFLGYSDNTPTNSWDAVYTMTKSGSVTVSPGDCFSLGKLNPLGRKKAKNETDWEAADALAAVFTPAIEIDHDFDDWNPANNDKIVGKIATSTGGTHYQELKVTYDDQYIYFYTKRDWASSGYDIWTGGTAYIYYGLDLDNDSATPASTLGEMPGADATILINPFSGSPASPVLSLGGTKLNGSSYAFTDILMDGVIGADYVEYEIRFKRSEVRNGEKVIADGNTINVYTWGNKSGSDFKTTPTTITIDDD